MCGGGEGRVFQCFNTNETEPHSMQLFPIYKGCHIVLNSLNKAKKAV